MEKLKSGPCDHGRREMAQGVHLHPTGTVTSHIDNNFIDKIQISFYILYWLIVRVNDLGGTHACGVMFYRTTWLSKLNLLQITYYTTPILVFSTYIWSLIYYI